MLCSGKIKNTFFFDWWLFTRGIKEGNDYRKKKKNEQADLKHVPLSSLENILQNVHTANWENQKYK